MPLLHAGCLYTRTGTSETYCFKAMTSPGGEEDEVCAKSNIFNFYFTADATIWIICTANQVPLIFSSLILHMVQAPQNLQVSVKWALEAGDSRSCLSVDLFPDFPFMDGYQQVNVVTYILAYSIRFLLINQIPSYFILHSSKR